MVTGASESHPHQQEQPLPADPRVWTISILLMYLQCSNIHVHVFTQVITSLCKLLNLTMMFDVSLQNVSYLELDVYTFAR